MGRTDVGHVAGIDRVRAVAALSVMLAHIVGPFMGEFRYIFTGGPAVVAFFVISGLCIHLPFVSGPLPATAFIASRWVRIVPPAFIAMIIAQSLGITPYNPIDGYILWSVVCELVYYTVYPLLHALRRRVSWWPMLFASVAVSYALVAILPGDAAGNIHAYGPVLTPVVCLPAWLLGCILAERIVEHGRGEIALPRLWFARIAVPLVAAALYWLTINSPVGFNITLLPFSVMAACWLSEEIAAGGRNHLDRLGKATFSVYLVHVLVAALLARLMPSLPPLAVVGVSLAGCIAFYYVIEMRFHSLARRVFKSLVINNGSANRQVV